MKFGDLQEEDKQTNKRILRFCREGHPNIINYLLDTDGQCWNTKSKNGRVPLHTVGEYIYILSVHSSSQFTQKVVLSTVIGVVYSSPWQIGSSKDSSKEVCCICSSILYSYKAMQCNIPICYCFEE